MRRPARRLLALVAATGAAACADAPSAPRLTSPEVSGAGPRLTPALPDARAPLPTVGGLAPLPSTSAAAVPHPSGPVFSAAGVGAPGEPATPGVDLDGGSSFASPPGDLHVVFYGRTTPTRALWVWQGSRVTQVVTMSQLDPAWRFAGGGDFDADGNEDLILENAQTGLRALWLLDGGGGVRLAVSLGVLGAEWHIAGAGDYNFDRRDDILLENTATGLRALWLMNGGAVTQVVTLGVVPVEWKMVAADDMNADGRDDVLLQHSTNGLRALWLMNGAGGVQSAPVLGTAPVAWEIAGTGDFDGDGDADVILQNLTTGDRALWITDGLARVTAAPLVGNVPADLSVGAVLTPTRDPVGTIANGRTYYGRIVRAGQTETWRFTAGLGERIVFGMGEQSGVPDFTPWIRLYGPNGAELISDWNAAAAQVAINAPAAGTYTVITGTNDSGRDAVGDYRVTLAKSPGAFTTSPGDEGGAMTNGGAYAGNITVGDVDMWSFTAAAGEYIAVSAGEGSATTDFAPWLRVIGPNGAELASDWSAAAAQTSLNAPATGTYTVIVGTNDSGRDATGEYRLSFLKAPGAVAVSPGDQGGEMVNGATHSGTISIGDLDAWTFSATAGDRIVVAAGESSASTGFTPWIRVIGPTGAELANDWNAAAAQVALNAPGTGSYTVIVGTNDSGRDDTGDYQVTLAKVPGTFTTSPGDEGGPIANGANASGTIGVGDVDMWSFTAAAGDYVVVSVGEGSAAVDFTPWVRVIGPTGTEVDSDWNTAAAQVAFSASAAGTYTVIVGTNDSGRDATGEYRLTLAKAPGAFTVPAGDQGGAMSNGVAYNGGIVVGDVDVWTFTAAAGSSVTLSMTEGSATADFTPWIRLIAPNGALMGNQSGASSAQINTTASAAGTYTVIVGTNDSGRDATGDYTITVAGSGIP